jgi:hypothetical protein
VTGLFDVDYRAFFRLCVVVPYLFLCKPVAGSRSRFFTAVFVMVLVEVLVGLALYVFG